jgi:parallel beta-helix repeat protein
MKTPLKTVLLLLFVLLGIAATAKTYYISNSGNDGNSGIDASSPWQTITKVNATTFQPGDNILFRRGDTFYGSIVVNMSGYSSTPITYGAYGTGAKPTITGFTSVTSWINKGGNIWESTNTVSTLDNIKTVVINGQSVPMGRYPNGDASYPFFPNFFNFQSHTGTGSGASSITTSSLTDGNDWTGADVVIRMNQWTFHREVITSQSGSTLNFNGAAGSLEDGWGFFIQNDIRTLDQQNEWYYNPSTKKISIYSTSMPTNVQVSTVDMLLNFYSNVPAVTCLNVDNLKFTGANTNGVWISGNSTFSITNCDVSYSGLEGMVLYGGGIKSGTIAGNSFTNNGSGGIFSIGDVQNLTITNNSISVSGIISAYKQNDYTNGGMTIYGPNSLIQYNTVDSSAYCGIEFKGANVQVRNNFVNHSALIRGDAGGIYTGFINETGKVIDGNIVLNSQGNPRGARSNDYFAMGIYIDDLGNNLSVTNNTIANCRTAGLYLHNANNLFIRNNTIYNCGALGTEVMWANGGISLDGNSNQFANTVYSNTLFSNIVFATNQYQYALNYYAESGGGNYVSNFGTIDSNYYAKVNSASTAIKSQQPTINGNMSLSGWQSQTGKDVHSKECVKTITDLNDVRFEYNATAQSKTIALDANYLDLKGKAYNGSVLLTPYSSVVLIKNGDLVNNQPPTASAGSSQTIILPTNSITLNGSGIDSDGTIASYRWTKVSGPSTYTISNASSATTSVNGLVAGNYVFKLTVTDNQAATATDSLTITVNPAANIAPTASAGSSQSITLPTNTITLNGGGIDSDGTIASYLWTKVSGPSTYTISNASSATTSVKGLITGNYVFKLTVTDNQAATATDSLTITVNPAANIAPTASAGSSQSITLPTNTVTLSGSGTDSDGTIASYVWTKVSGPSTYTISNASSATTSVKGLIAGNYVFKLTVTDNQGATATDSVSITVNPAANIPPTAIAGSSQTITLPTNSITLNGSGIDSDGTIASYLWTKVSGPSTYTISNSSSATTSVKGLITGVYVFKLTVTDNQGATATDSVSITVNPPANIAPTTNAGSDQVITLPINSVILSGSGTDSDGSISSYSWTKISGPSSFSIKNSSSAASQVSGLVEGVYQFELKVTDDKGAIGKDTIQITVNAAKNISPKANAGLNQSITLPTNSITLNGSGADSDGSIAAYLWTKISGPSAYIIANPSSASSKVSGLVEGVYQFELKVTDDKGAIGTDTMQLTVNKNNVTVTIPNVAPTVYVGNDTTVLSPVNSIVLNGSANDIDGKITGYLWTQLSGPSTSTILPNNTASTTISSLIAGTYEFELKVTDNAGGEARDTVKVTIALGRTAQDNLTGLKVYPNPVHNIANVELNTQADNSRITIRIADISGNIVYQNEFVSITSNVKKQIDMSSLGKGTYIVTVLVDGVVKQSAKVVKM